MTSSGAAQQVIAPSGATRLVLGVMDQFQWSDNEGAFTVQVSKAISAPALQLSLRPSLKPTDADATANPVNPPKSASVVTTPLSASATIPDLQVFSAIELVWPSETNHYYQLQWTPSLAEPQWINLGPVISGSGSSVSVFDSTRIHPQGFYRVQIVSG